MRAAQRQPQARAHRAEEAVQAAHAPALGRWVVGVAQGVWLRAEEAARQAAHFSDAHNIAERFVAAALDAGS